MALIKHQLNFGFDKELQKRVPNYCSQQGGLALWRATNIFSAFCSLIGFSSSRRNTNQQQN